MKEDKKTFVDFILDAMDDTALAESFITASTNKDLKEVFENNGYTISAKEFKKIKEIKNKTVKPRGPVPFY